MSDLPTLYAVTAARPDGGRKIVMHRKEHRGQHERPFVTLDEKHAREQESESVPGVVVVVPYVPAAALKAAQDEVATLKAQAEKAQILFASIRQADALAPWACESVSGEASFDEQIREMLRDLEKITGFAARQRAALTPKESSDG